MNPKNPKYRLYVDETGNASYPRKETAAVGQRFLALTGIIISEDEYTNVLCPKIDNLKYFLTGDYDEKFTLHRDEIKNRSGVYAPLQDHTKEETWNELMEDLLKTTDYTIICAVIDKVEHKTRYPTPQHPYYYCLEVLLERYVRFLEEHNGVGDVMFEARGKAEDTELKRQYERLYTYGNRYMTSTMMQKHLTSHKLKIKDKSKMITGLELADLLALATKLDTLLLYGKINTVASKFMAELIGWINSKYRSKDGTRRGIGCKLLP